MIGATSSGDEQTLGALSPRTGELLQDADRERGIAPPAEVQAIHGNLLAWLRQTAADLSQLSDQVASMELCATPSILAAVSNAPGADNLRTVREALGSGRLGRSEERRVGKECRSRW